MTIALFFLAWYALGLFGSALVLYFGFLKDGMDVDVRDCIFGAVIAISGPISLLTGIVFVFGFIIHSAGFDGRRVVFRASGRR
jgi:hypothetical protein